MEFRGYLSLAEAKNAYALHLRQSEDVQRATTLFGNGPDPSSDSDDGGSSSDTESESEENSESSREDTSDRNVKVRDSRCHAASDGSSCESESSADDSGSNGGEPASTKQESERSADKKASSADKGENSADGSESSEDESESSADETSDTGNTGCKEKGTKAGRKGDDDDHSKYKPWGTTTVFKSEVSQRQNEASCTPHASTARVKRERNLSATEMNIRPKMPKIIHQPPTPNRILEQAPDFIPLDDSDSGCRDVKPSLKQISSRPSSVNDPTVGPALCQEQAELVELVARGHNVFYTGSAGVGKSTVLRHIVRRLKGMGLRVQTVAPTGRAALDISGSTLWTFAGWIPDDMKKSLRVLEEEAHRKQVWRRLANTDVLVIDEISMIENHIFERLNRIMKSARSPNEKARLWAKPFGGVQLVVLGDFCQLPPVQPFRCCMECGKETVRVEGQKYTCIDHGTFLDKDKWAFRSVAWRESQFLHINLRSIHRQHDPRFIAILEKCRLGNPLSAQDKELLLNHECDTTGAVKLYPLKASIREENMMNFNRLKSPIRTFTCSDDFNWNKEHAHLKNMHQRVAQDGSLEALHHHRYEQKVELRTGMLVILLQNLDLKRELINGSQGTIVGFRPHTPTTISELTANKSGYQDRLLKDFVGRNDVKGWPVVKFTTGAQRIIYADCAVNSLGDEQPYSLLSRTQIPLIAGWALTVHKAQGMTLSRVVVDLWYTFESGQDYVALSRARGLEGLKVTRLPKKEKSANAQVKEFLLQKFAIQ